MVPGITAHQTSAARAVRTPIAQRRKRRDRGCRAARATELNPDWRTRALCVRERRGRRPVPLLPHTLSSLRPDAANLTKLSVCTSTPLRLHQQPVSSPIMPFLCQKGQIPAKSEHLGFFQAPRECWYFIHFSKRRILSPSQLKCFLIR